MPNSAHSLATPPRRQSATRIPTICVVDPQTADYQGWDAIAAASGARVRTITSAEEALRLARTTAVDLWLVNAQLPGLSGCELCGMLKSRTPAVPVYLVTDDYTPATEQAAWAAGATLFGCKPGHDIWLAQWLHLQSHHRERCQPFCTIP